MAKKGIKKFVKYQKIKEEISEEEKKRRITQRQYESSLIYKYAIVKCHNKKKTEELIKVVSYADLELFKEKVLRWNNRVRIPRCDKDSEWEWVFLQRPDTYGEWNSTTTMTNRVGKTVERESTNDMWEIIDVVPIDMDLTFSLLGKQFPRYTYYELCRSYVDPYIDNRMFVKVSRLNNKIILEYERDEMKAIVCRSSVEAKEFYCNLLYDYGSSGFIMMMKPINAKGKKDEMNARLVELSGVSEKIVKRFRTYK